MWGLNFGEVLMVEAFKKPFLSTGCSEICVRNCKMNCSENCSDVGIMLASLGPFSTTENNLDYQFTPN